LEDDTETLSWRQSASNGAQKHAIFIYSAFYDGRFDTGHIRVVGVISRVLEIDKVWCTFSETKLSPAIGTIDISR
jgi:hypothetical protein